MRVRHRHRAGAAVSARQAVSLLVRAAPAILIGIALAGFLWLGLIPVALRLYAQRRSLAGTYVSWLVDVLLLAVNAALLVALLKVAGLSPDPPSGRSRLGCGACRAEGGDEYAHEHIRRSVSERAQEPTPGARGRRTNEADWDAGRAEPQEATSTRGSASVDA